MAPDTVAAQPSPLEPTRPGALDLRHRIRLAPRCQDVAEPDCGVRTDRHLMHLGTRAAGGRIRFVRTLRAAVSLPVAVGTMTEEVAR